MAKDYRYHIGVDMAQGSDYTMYCISKYPSEFMRLVNRILRRENKPKIIYMGDDERVMRKYKYKSAIIKEGI